MNHICEVLIGCSIPGNRKKPSRKTPGTQGTRRKLGKARKGVVIDRGEHIDWGNREFCWLSRAKNRECSIE